jgi:hypothetical protein
MHFLSGASSHCLPRKDKAPDYHIARAQREFSFLINRTGSGSRRVSAALKVASECWGQCSRANSS